jgi:hypothetical protein
MDRIFRPSPALLHGTGRRHMAGAPGADHAASTLHFIFHDRKLFIHKFCYIKFSFFLAARMWKYVTFVGTGISLAWAAKELMEHEEEEEYKPVAYRNVR